MAGTYETMALTTFALALVSTSLLGLMFVPASFSIGLTSYFLLIMSYCADMAHNSESL